METGKNLAQLSGETSDLGLVVIPTGKNGKLMKKDYVKSLMLYNLIKRYGSLEDVPVNLKFRMSFDSPQLAYNYFDLKPKEHDTIWDDPNVWLTEKINGVRGTLVFSKKEGYSVFSRDIDDNDYLWTDYTGKVLGPEIKGLGLDCALDLEIQLGNKEVTGRLKELNYEVVSDFQVISSLFMLDKEIFEQIKKDYPGLFKFKILDVYYWQGDARKYPYKDRASRFDSIVGVMREKGFVIERPQYCTEPVLKKAFHEGIMKQGGEGTIAVFIDKPCNLSGSRRRDEMIKIKRPVFPLLLEPDALTDTVDGWVQEVIYRGELLDKLVVYAFDEKGEKKIATVEAIPLSLRLSGLLKEGTVIEISGTKWEGGLIQNAALERVRFDKEKGSCVLH